MAAHVNVPLAAVANSCERQLEGALHDLLETSLHARFFDLFHVPFPGLFDAAGEATKPLHLSGGAKFQDAQNITYYYLLLP